MRLKELEITNFRSVKSTTLTLLDNAVTTLMGVNGSGKSNILKALVSLKGDNSTPSDADFHAKNLSGTDEPISISATFIFEPRDTAILEANGLKGIKVEGFKVTVQKSAGEDPTIAHDPIGYTDRREENVLRIQKELARLIKGLTVESSQKEVKQACVEKLEQPIDLDDKAADIIAELKTFFEPLKAINVETTEKFNKSAQDLNGWLAFSMDGRLSKVFGQLNIELLQLNAYSIENNAPIAELQDRSKHPFLYDLLQLTGRSATAFTPTNTPLLSRIKRQASEQLSTSISNIWLSHDLKFEIDKQGENLEFMVFTPQGHQVSLTDLSDGEQWFLKFYVRLAIAQKENKQIIWLFDEPGRDLHTSSQVDLKGFFETISVDAQVIYTSHLAMMIPWHRLERIFAVENSTSEGTIVHKRFWKDSKLDSPLREALSTFVGEELLGGKEHLIVEGVSDYFFLQGWIRYFQAQSAPKAWATKYTLYKRIFVPVDGIDKIPLYCWFLGRQVRKRINWVVIVDSAGESTATAKKMTDSGLGSWTKNIKSIGEVAGAKKSQVEEVEGIFKPIEYIQLFENFYVEAYPECDRPTSEEILEKQKTVPKITKAIEELLIARNPNAKTKDGLPIGLDKTGISQHAYKLLGSGKFSFSKDTEVKFARIFENIDSTFDNQVEER